MSNEFIVRIDFDRSIISRFERDDRPTSHAQQLADRHSRAANDDADLDFDFLDHFHLAVPLAFVGTLASGPWHQGFGLVADALDRVDRSEEHTSEFQSLMRISYDVFCLQKKRYNIKTMCETK